MSYIVSRIRPLRDRRQPAAAVTPRFPLDYASWHARLAGSTRPPVRLVGLPAQTESAGEQFAQAA